MIISSFHLGIGYVFYISLRIWDPIEHLLASIESRNRFDGPFFDRIYIKVSIFRIMKIEPIGCPTRADMT